MNNYIILGILISLSMNSDSTLSADDKLHQQTRQSIAKALDYMKERGQYWHDKKKCVSCHRTAFVPWALRTAKRKGVQVFDDDISDWTASTIKLMQGPKNTEGLSQMLLGRDRNSPDREKFVGYAKILLETQRSDGSWKANGQLPRQKRPQPETVQVTTMWNALALENSDFAELKGRKKAIVSAREYLAKFSKGESSEWYAVNLLLADEDKQQETYWKHLKETQHDDGGWGWLLAEESDALATGLVLYALRVKLGDSTQAQAAHHFLLKTQQPNGSWKVKGTKQVKRTKIAETAVYWGTCWAAIGMLETLP